MIAVLVVYGINEAYMSETRQGLIFLIFSIFMAFGAFYSWAYLPNVQRRVIDPYDVGGRGKAKLETKNLEDLGEGRERAKTDGEVITLQEKVGKMKRRRRGVLRSGTPAGGGGYDTRGQEFDTI